MTEQEWLECNRMKPMLEYLQDKASDRETTHNKINADLGRSDDPATKALFDFLGKALKK